MAGTQGSPSDGRVAGRNGTPPARLSPRVSMDATLDLLTGVFPPTMSSSNNPFVQDQSSPIDRGGADRNQTSPSPPLSVSTQFGAVDGNPNHQNLYSSHEPFDLLTGLFPPPIPQEHSPTVVSPIPQATIQQDAWGAEILGQPPTFDSGRSGSGIDLFGAPEIAPNNPFLSNPVNPVRSPGYSAPPLPPNSRRGSDAADVVPNLSNNNNRRSGFMDGSFAKFPPVTESMASAADLGGRSSYSAGNKTPSPTAATSSVSRTSQSVGNGASPSPSPNSSANKFSPAQATESFSKSEFVSPGRLSSTSSGGFERVQNGQSRAESPSVSSSPQMENLRKSVSESTYDHWMPSEEGTLSRLSGKESGTSMSASSKIGGADGEYFFGAPGKGIFKSPGRGAVHPRRPVSLELRPHPLRGAPTNQVSLLTCLEGSVWAVCDLGLMVWDIKNATGEGSTATVYNEGDEDAAAYGFLRIQGSPALCIIADVANQVVWTGHRDGKIRSWSAPAAPGASPDPRSASLTFQALRHAVTAIIFTPYGELWAGSESGELKAWPWNAVAKALSGVGDSASLMEKSYNDLRIGIFEVGPNGPINPEVRFLVGDHAHGTVWCAGTQYIAIWDARTRERLKMYVGPNGLDLNSIDVGSPGREIRLDDDLKVGGYAKVSSKKDKGGWLQRSRNAVLGAADAVRRAASGVAQGNEEGRKLEALVATADGTIWGGYGNGVLAQWDWEGYRMQEVQKRPVGVKTLCVVGNRLWVGYSDGKLHVLAGDTGKAVGSWLAHRLAVIDMAVSGGYVFSLGGSGSIRGWNISSPNRDLDEIIKAAMTNRADLYTRQKHLQVLVGTWNTAQEKASLQTIKFWLGSAAEASVVVIGLEEVEMGAGAIGMAAVKETVGMEKGSATGQVWLAHLDHVLGEMKEFERVGSRQLAGMLIGVWIRRKVLPYVGDIEVGAVACGFGRTLGNKGAVGVKLMIFRRNICFLTSHLAAHMEHVSRRNADFEHIYNQMSFGRTNNTAVANVAAGVSSAVQNMLRGGNTARRVSITSDQNCIEREAPLNQDSSPVGEDAGVPELSDADLLIWTGDLNYRVDLSYEEITHLIRKKQWDTLLSKDQLRVEMANGRTFQGFREGAIRFPPTYKFDKGTTVYDTSEKRRIPAWCDRVVFRDSFCSESDFYSASKQGLTRPCKASVVRYEACMEPEESDHKPVLCMLSVDLSVTDEADRRYEYGRIMNADPQIQTRLAVSGSIPETAIGTNGLVLEGNLPSMLRLSNGDRLHRVVYIVHCEGLSGRGPCPCGKHSKVERNSEEDQYPRGGYGFPTWLKVVPAAGVLGPSESTSISVKAEKRPEERGQIQLENVVILVVNVKGVFSSEYKQHRICVSRVSSTQSLPKEKDGRRRSLDQPPRRSSSAGSDSQGYGSRPGHGSNFTKNIPDLLL